MKAKSPYTIGFDLSDLKVAVCVIDNDGKIVEEHSLPNKANTYVATSKTYPGATVALEPGTHSPWVSRVLRKIFLGHPLIAFRNRMF